MIFFSLIKMVNFFFWKSIKIVRSNNGGEFTSTKFRNLLDDLDIIYQFSCTYTPSQNAMVERKHRYLMNVVKTLHFQGNIPLTYCRDIYVVVSIYMSTFPS